MNNMNIKMEIPSAVGKEAEFQSAYNLLKFGKKTLASPMVALGFPAFSPVQGTTEEDEMDYQLKKLDSYCE